MKTVMDAMAECLAGMPNSEVSPEARRKIEACLKASSSIRRPMDGWDHEAARIGRAAMDRMQSLDLIDETTEDVDFVIEQIGKLALSASPAGVVKPLEDGQNYNCRCIHPSQCDNSCMSAIEPAGVGVETAVRKHLEWFERFICDENELNSSTPRKVARNAQDAAAELRAALTKEATHD